MSSIYVCYDLKGIQKLIFQIPKLKCAIGGSRQLDQYDREDVETIKIPGVKKIFCGGGKGAFECPDTDTAHSLEKALTKLAWDKGLTIHFGIDEDYATAATSITSIYSYLPTELDGEPCALSGLYPVAGGRGGIHPLIQKRVSAGTHANDLEQGLLADLQGRLSGELSQKCVHGLEFFANVDAGDADGYDGAVVLGSRNRWAVICMDGNDMGEQFRAAKEKMAGAGGTVDGGLLRRMSEAVGACTREAVLLGMQEVCKQYFSDGDKAGKPKCSWLARAGQEVVYSSRSQALILPMRPLILGGDDVTVIMHASYARVFAEKVMEEFNRMSGDSEYSGYWSATGGRLTISAGILYAPVHLPLSSAIAYAEMLLASAKGKGRKLRAAAPKDPSPACLDWESVTGGLLDSVHNRRQREMHFRDKTCGKTIELTSRPYSLKEMEKLDILCAKLQGIPASIRHEVLPSLRSVLDDRLAYYARVRKNHQNLADFLQEPCPESRYQRLGSEWSLEGDRQKTRVVDALLCLEEESRMSAEKQTVEGVRGGNE